jgi:hypothetical protein
VLDLNALAASILPLANTESHLVIRSGQPRPRLTVLLGAGASLYAGAPSTQKLTKVVAQRPISGAIFRILSQQNYAAVNFEDVLFVLEELDLLLGASVAPASAMLRPFLERSNLLASVATDLKSVLRERFDLLGVLADEFKDIDYNASWKPLYSVLKPLVDIFDLDIFTLNYDLVADVVTYALGMLSDQRWFDGFGVGPMNNDLSAPFRPDLYANWYPSFGPQNLTLAHLHGSLAFAYHKSDRRMAYSGTYEIVKAESVAKARATWEAAASAALADPNVDFAGALPIVSGRRKLEKLNVRPYANYYAGFSKALSTSPYLLIAGYSGGDEHINCWLREFGLIHGEGVARIVEITRSDDPPTFSMQKIGAYDFSWHKFRANDDIFLSLAGAHCLTITGGILKERIFDERLNRAINAQYAGDLRDPRMWRV